MLTCCRKPYNPPASSTAASYLVVEGVIDSTIIKLSKTVKLNDSVTINPLPGATVTVEGSQSNSYTLADVNNNGTYASPPLGLTAGQQYRLRIVTPGGSQYLSDFITPEINPPIDSVNYLIKGNSLNLYVNMHNPANNTLYYRWDFDETYQFHAKYQSSYVLDPASNSIVPRSHPVYYCFGNDRSSNILLTSTTKLVNDVVSEYPLTTITSTSEKLEIKYSILVNQYALTEAAYEFIKILK